ncbi:HAH_0734 family protein [Halovivax cerinus]|uniref:HAH_0734 family protein n=1 Tax=Halovivax cerinus TaxID=1487865 RepID=A0ABD5NK36_9EURY|nr:HAH_0734 family protein [Halovivax cerinus]
MKQLIIHGDPGIRKDAVITVDGEEFVCFGINRMGEWHGPDRVQLWCTVGSEDERDAYDRRSYIPHFLDVEHYDESDVAVVASAA